MARKLRSARLETRTARLVLPVRKKPTFTSVARGVGLGYRRNRTAGTWIVRAGDGHGKFWTKAIAAADDFEDANGKTILDFWQACERARTNARGSGTAETGRPATWAEAIDGYEADLKARGGRPVNAQCLRRIVPSVLQSKPVSLLTAKELRKWRDVFVARGLAPGTVVRYCRSAGASLNLAAKLDKRITNADAWRDGLEALPDSRKARNQVLSDDMVGRVVAAAYAFDPSFGLLVEVLAVGGARPIQVCRLVVADVQVDRVQMPRSVKGRGVKKITRRPVPLPSALIAKLKAAAAGRAGDAPLLLQSDGQPWLGLRLKITRSFACALEAAKLPKATPYALRH